MNLWTYLDNRDKRRVDHLDSADRFWLLTLGLGALVSIAAVALLTILHGVPENAAALLGTIVGGLLMFMREIVQAIRNFWTDARAARMSDQLAGAPPPGSPAGTPDDPLSVAGAAPSADAPPVATTEITP